MATPWMGTQDVALESVDPGSNPANGTSCQWRFFIGKNKGHPSGLLMRLETMCVEHRVYF